MEIKVRYALDGIVNGAKVGGAGVGQIQSGTRNLEFELCVEPQCPDPRLILLGCTDGLLLASAPTNDSGRSAWLDRLFGPDNVPIQFSSHVMILDDCGRNAGFLNASSILDIKNRCGSQRVLEYSSRVTDGRVSLLPRERVTARSILGHLSIVSPSPSSPWTIMNAAWSLHTNMGASYRILSTSSFELGGGSFTQLEQHLPELSFDDRASNRVLVALNLR